MRRKKHWMRLCCFALNVSAWLMLSTLDTTALLRTPYTVATSASARLFSLAMVIFDMEYNYGTQGQVWSTEYITS